MMSMYSQQSIFKEVPNENDDYLTSLEACRLLGVTDGILSYYVRTGKIDYVYRISYKRKLVSGAPLRGWKLYNVRKFLEKKKELENYRSNGEAASILGVTRRRLISLGKKDEIKVIKPGTTHHLYNIDDFLQRKEEQKKYLPSPYISRQRAVERLGVSANTVHCLGKSGVIPRKKIDNRHHMYDITSVLEKEEFSKRYVTAKKVSETCDVSVVTVRHWAAKGLIDFIRLPGGRVRFDLEAFMSKHILPTLNFRRKFNPMAFRQGGRMYRPQPGVRNYKTTFREIMQKAGRGLEPLSLEELNKARAAALKIAQKEPSHLKMLMDLYEAELQIDLISVTSLEDIIVAKNQVMASLANKEISPTKASQFLKVLNEAKELDIHRTVQMAKDIESLKNSI